MELCESLEIPPLRSSPLVRSLNRLKKGGASSQAVQATSVFLREGKELRDDAMMIRFSFHNTVYGRHEAVIGRIGMFQRFPTNAQLEKENQTKKHDQSENWCAKVYHK